MPLPADLKSFLESLPFDGIPCSISGPIGTDVPVVFFVPYGASKQQAINPEWEKIHAQVIRRIYEKAGVQHVFIEGHDTELSARGVSAQTADQLLASGSMTGADHAAAVCPGLTMVGIDHVAKYRACERANNQIQLREDDVQHAFATIEEALGHLLNRAGLKVRELVIKRASHNSGKLRFDAYVRWLWQEAQSAGVSLDHGQHSLRRLYETLQMEGETDFEAAEQEKVRLGELLAKAASDDRVLSEAIAWAVPAQSGTRSAVRNLEDLVELTARRLQDASDDERRAARDSVFWSVAMLGAQKLGLDALEDAKPAGASEMARALLNGLRAGLTCTLGLLLQEGERCRAGQITAASMYDLVLDAALLFRFQGDIPNIVKYVQYGNRYASVSMHELFQEINEIEERLLARFSGAEHDSQVLALHRAYEELKQRVQLHVSPGEPSDRFIRQGKDSGKGRSAVLQRSALLLGEGQGVAKALNSLGEMEDVARQFYKAAQGRAGAMASNLGQELRARHLDRAIVDIGGYHLHAMIKRFKQKERGACLLAILPWQSTAAGGFEFIKDPLEQFRKQPPAQVIAAATQRGKKTHSHLRDCCQTRFCRTCAPLYWEEVICLHPPGASGAFWCSTCGKVRCGLELAPAYLSQTDFFALPESDPTRRLAVELNKWPFRLRCLHCGLTIGQGWERILWRPENAP